MVPPFTTAFSPTATLKSNTEPIEIVSSPVGMGSLPLGVATQQPVTFQLRVAQNAKPGTYQLELEFEYQYLNNVDWLNPAFITTPYYEAQYRFFWSGKTESQEIPIKIVGTYFSVKDIKAEDIRAGATGTITATIANSGGAKASEATAEIVPGGSFVPVDKGVFLGNLNSDESKAAQFKVTVSAEAIAKTSPLNIAIKYKDENDVPRQTVLNVGIPIGTVENGFLVTSVGTDGISAGTTGIITVTLKNNAAGQAHEVTAEIVPGQYFVPVDTRSFLGDVKNGDSTTTRFKVSVSKDALAKTSPLDILVKYNDENNVPRQAQLTVGVPVKEEPEFEIQPVRVNGKLTPGAETVIEIPIKNASDYTLKDATARINIVDPFSTAPFSTTDDTAYIGTLRPGESGTGRFKISVDSDVVPKPYTVEVEVKYWDSLGNSYISEPMYAVVSVQPPSEFSITTIILISLVAIVIVGIMFYIIRKRVRSAPRG